MLAFWYFDWSNWNSIIVSVLLFSIGIDIFLVDTDSNFLLKIRKLIRKTALLLAIILLIRVFL